MTTSKNTAMVAMSGGVDSTVCALLLQKAGYVVTGVTCKMFGSKVMDEESLEKHFLTSVENAKTACRKMGIEHFTFNCKALFEREVINHFVSEYLHGRTPNPCVDCNKNVKFGQLHTRRQELELEKLATGHYARIKYDSETARWKLLRATYLEKDQSYMLFNLTQEQLAHTLFPLGDLAKDEVRALASAASFKNADAPESQDICFVPDGDYLNFVKSWVAEGEFVDLDCPLNGTLITSALEDGEIVDETGKVLGKHSGIAAYTIGQRKGLGIAANEPLYVVSKDAKTNTLVVGPHSSLMTNSCTAESINFVSLSPEEALAHNETRPLRVLAKTSYRQQPKPALAVFSDESTFHGEPANTNLEKVYSSCRIDLTFDDEVTRPAPGQALVLYDFETGEEVLAGGIIS